MAMDACAESRKLYYDKYTFKTMEARKTVGIALDIVGKAGVTITDTRFKKGGEV